MTALLAFFVSFVSHLGVHLGRRQSSLASLVVALASQVTRAFLALACRRRAPPAPSTTPRVARCHDGVAWVSRLSRPHAGVCLRRRQSLLASLVVSTAPQITRASLALACRRRAHPVPSTFLRVVRCHDGIACDLCFSCFSSRRAPQATSVFACVTRRRDGVPSHSRIALARVPSARASRAFDLPSRRLSPRQRCLRFVCRVSHLGVRLKRRRSSLASIVVATASQESLARLSRSRAVGARLPRLRPCLASLVATTALLAFCISRDSHLGVCLGRSRSSLASLVIALAS